MLLLTTQTLPQGLIVKQVFSLVLINQRIEIANGNIIKVLLGRNQDDYENQKQKEFQKALDSLVLQAPKEANAIIGIQISASTQQFSDSVSLYLTAVGTPVIYGEA